MLCRTGVVSNSIFCNSCKHWVHKKCSGLERLTKDTGYRCTGCQGTACFLDGRPRREVRVGSDKLKVKLPFATSGGMLSAAGGCELSTTTHVKTPGRNSRSCYLFSLPATSLSRQVSAYTAPLCGAQFSMPVRLGH